MLTRRTEMKVKVFVSLGLLALIAISFGWFLASSSVSDNARVAAVKALQDNLRGSPKKGTLIIVDFTKPSQSKRRVMIKSCV